MSMRENVLLAYSTQQMQSYVFMVTHRTSPAHFARECKMGLNFKNMMLILLRMVKKPAKVELMDTFYDMDKQVPSPSRQAFSKAREKISHLAIKDLFDKSCELVVDMDTPKQYCGYRLFAIDGTTFVVDDSNDTELVKYFGESSSVKDKAMCCLSCVVDVLDDTIVDACPSPFNQGERALAVKQVQKLKNTADALFLFDRGYWSEGLVQAIVNNKQKFLIRLQSNNPKVGITDEGGNFVGLRRHSFILPSGTKEILITNIPEDEMSDDELAVLYAKRWDSLCSTLMMFEHRHIETKYLELKDRLQIDKFSGQSTNAILQDIFATLYISNLVSFIADTANEAIKAKTSGKDNKYQQKVNKSVSIATLRTRFIDIFLSDSPVQMQKQIGESPQRHFEECHLQRQIKTTTARQEKNQSLTTAQQQAAVVNCKLMTF